MITAGRHREREQRQGCGIESVHMTCTGCISGLVAEYIVAIDVTRAQFPADAVVGVLLSVDVVICATRHI